MNKPLYTYIRVVQCESHERANWYATFISMAGFNTDINYNTDTQKYEVRVNNSTNGKITFEDLLDEVKSLGYVDACIIMK